MMDNYESLNLSCIVMKGDFSETMTDFNGPALLYLEITLMTVLLGEVS